MGASWLLLSNFWHYPASSEWYRAMSDTGQAVKRGPRLLLAQAHPVLPGGPEALCARG